MSTSRASRAFGRVRVFGDEVFSPGGSGYNMHRHHNFIIAAFVLGGELTHVNTIGKVDELRAGDFYVFSAGSGGKHAELNIGAVETNVIYLWVLPGRLLAPPTYARGRFNARENANRITCLVGSEVGALPIGQDIKVSRLVNERARTHVYRSSPSRGVYAFVLEGEAEIAGTVSWPARQLGHCRSGPDRDHRPLGHRPAAGRDGALAAPVDREADRKAREHGAEQVLGQAAKPGLAGEHPAKAAGGQDDGAVHQDTDRVQDRRQQQDLQGDPNPRRDRRTAGRVPGRTAPSWD